MLHDSTCLRRAMARSGVVSAVMVTWLLPCYGEDGKELARVKQAIERAIPMMEIGSIGSADQRECFTCHHQAHPVMALTQAKMRGFKVDEANLQRQIQHTYEHLRRGLKNYQQDKGQGGGVLTAGYALWTLEVGGWKGDEVTQAVHHYIARTQAERAFWRHKGSRPPSSGSDFTVTYVALRSLAQYTSSASDKELDERKSKIAEWLQSSEPIETEDMVFRLRAIPYLSDDPSLVERAAQGLLAIQHEDGAWGQTPDQQGDAYATGTALTALLEVGAISRADPRIQKGIGYLLRTQGEDGTWHVTTRAKPFQEYFETGFPHGEDQFISMSATAWSTLALLTFLPAEQAAVNSVVEP